MFGDIIKNLRTSHNLNQVQLAQKLNVSKQTVSNWENNNILPSIEMLVKIADFFCVSADFLLERDNQRYRINRISAGTYSENHKRHLR